MGHHSIGGDRHPADPAGIGRQLRQQRIDRLIDHRPVKLPLRPGRTLARGNPVDHIVSKPELPVRHPRRCDDPPILHQQCGHRRGADIHRNRQASGPPGQIRHRRKVHLHRPVAPVQRGRRNPDLPLGSGGETGAGVHRRRLFAPQGNRAARRDEIAANQLDPAPAATPVAAAAQIQPYPRFPQGFTQRTAFFRLAGRNSATGVYQQFHTSFQCILISII